MDTLTRHIRHRLSEHKSCTVFENELSRVWPYIDKEREKRFDQIKAFAKARGWSATILDPGIRVTFRKLPDESNRRRARGIGEKAHR